MATLTQDNRDACLADLATALSTTSKMYPFVNTPTLGPGMVLADFQIAASTGLAAGKTVTAWSDPYTRGDGERVITGEIGSPWVATGGIPDGGETVQGWIVTDSTSMVVEAAEYLEEPVAIANVGDGFNKEPDVQYGA